MTWRSSGSITVSTPGSFVQQSPSTCCGLAGYWGQGGQTRPPLQGRGSAVTWTALGRAKAARGGALGSSRTHGRSHAPSAQRAAAARAVWPATNDAFPPGSGMCWGSAAGRGRGGICQNCECTCVPRQDESTSRFRRTDDTRQVTLAQRCPRGNGADKPVATGRGENGGTPTLLGCPDHTVTPASALGSPRPRRGTGR